MGWALASSLIAMRIFHIPTCAISSPLFQVYKHIPGSLACCSACRYVRFQEGGSLDVMHQLHFCFTVIRQIGNSHLIIPYRCETHRGSHSCNDTRQRAGMYTDCISMHCHQTRAWLSFIQLPKNMLFSPSGLTFEFWTDSCQDKAITSCSHGFI